MRLDIGYELKKALKKISPFKIKKRLRYCNFFMPKIKPAVSYLAGIIQSVAVFL